MAMGQTSISFTAVTLLPYVSVCVRLSSGQLKAQSCRKLHSNGLCFQGCSFVCMGDIVPGGLIG